MPIAASISSDKFIVGCRIGGEYGQEISADTPFSLSNFVITLSGPTIKIGNRKDCGSYNDWNKE